MTKPKSKRIRTTIRVSEEIYKWIDAKAQERDVSRNLIISEAIKRNIKSELNAMKKREDYEKKKNEAVKIENAPG